MKISKKDALMWFRFFAELPEDEALLPRQQEIAYAVFAQIEEAVEARNAARLAAIPGARSLEGRSWFVGDPEKFARGCRGCLLGTGLTAIRKTNRCNLNCPFCYDYGCLDEQPPIGDNLWEIGGTRFREEDIDLLLQVYPKPSGVCYVYLEPFMEIEKYPPVIRRFHAAGVWQHLYTNGTLCTEENLRALGEAGLDELRFNLGASGCAPKVIEAMRTAARFIPHVGIETPMTPDFLRGFRAHKEEILASGAEFMNCAELHLNANNLGNYAGEKLYLSRLGYLSPIFSREITLTLMAEADAEGWPLTVHDCSNRTKFARDLHLCAQEGKWFGASTWGSEFDRIPYAAFLPVLEDETFAFLSEEPLPVGYRPGDIVL